MLPQKNQISGLYRSNWLKKLFKNKFILIGLAIFLLLVAVGISFSIQNANKTTASAATCTWSGDNGGNFSDPANWSSCPTGSGVPEDYDTLYFPSSANNYYLNNDLYLSVYGAFIVEPLNNSDYTLTGGSISNWQSLDTQSGGGGRFIFEVDAVFCGINGGGRVEIAGGYTLTTGCYNNATYNFSGTMTGTGTFTKVGNGTQLLENATIESGVTTNNEGSFLQPTGNTIIDGPMYSTGGVLLTGTPTINNFTQNGNGINLYPGNVTNFNSYNLNSGNFGVDASGVGNNGVAYISNDMYLSNGTVSMRFFGSYNIGEAYTLMGTTGGASIYGEFSNAPEGYSILAEGWGPSSVINDVRVRINYTSNSVIATIISVTSKACQGDKTYNTNSGTVSSGPIDYLANSNCRFIIAPSNADSIALNFTSFNTENVNDEVKIYDGITTSSPLLGTFSGNTLPGTITSTSGTLLIIFTSNGTVESSGFSANWTTNPTPPPTISSVNVSSGPVAGGTNITATGSNFISGQYQNIRSLGSVGYDGARGMVVDSTGQYVSGEFSGTITLGSTTLTSSGEQDIYIAKLDSSGNYIWATKAGGSTRDGFTRKQSMGNDSANGAIVISGYYSGTANFGSTTLSGSTGSNIFIAKIDKATGAFIWAKTGGGSSNTVFETGTEFPYQFGSNVDTDSAGNIYFSGKTQGPTATFGGISFNIPSPFGELYIAKLNSSGDFQWVKHYSHTTITDPLDLGGNNGQSHGLAVDLSNNIYVALGYRETITIGSTTLTSLSTSNIAVVKLDSSGNEVWAVNGGTNGAVNQNSDLPYGIGIDSSQNIYLTGYIGGALGTFGGINIAGSATGSTVFTAKLDPSGNYLWVRALPGAGFATSRDIHVDANNKVWIAGGYTNALSDGNKTISGNGTNAFFAQYDTSGNLVQLNSIGGTGGQLAVGGVGGNQVRAVYEYDGKLYIAGEYFDTIGIGGRTITSAGNQDGFYTYYSPDDISIKIDGIEVIANFVSATQLNFTTPPNTTGFKDIVVTNYNGQSYTLVNGFEYIGEPITNDNISSMVCSPSSTNIDTTVDCVITTNININTLGGNVNVRIGPGGAITSCPVSGAGTTIICNNIAVGSTTGIYASQYNGSGSGSIYLDGNNITVTAPTVTINPIAGSTLGGTLVTASIANATFSDGPDVIQTSVGQAHTCALLNTGNVKCWGYGYYGSLGYGNTNSIGGNGTPANAGNVDVGGFVTQISTGQNHTCALLSNGNVRCWGEGSYGQLGYGNTNSIGDDETPASAGDVNVGGTVTQISTGAYHTCALLNTGNVRCWGYGNYGSLGYGNGDIIGDDETPAIAGDVNVGGTVTQISAGGLHTCALLSNGNVRCWGYADSGQLGYGNTNYIGDDETPAVAGDVNVGGTVTQISAGGSYNCALLSTGNVRCWGANNAGQLGYGNTNNIGDDEIPSVAGDVSIGETVTQISTGESHVCALLSTGNIKCWGNSDYGRLGYANTSYIGDDEIPSNISNVNVGGTVIQISTGAYNTCVLLSTSNVKCWGDASYGQLGYANYNQIGDNETPASIGTISVVNPSEITPVSITFDGLQATSVTYVNNTTITGITPAHAVGTVNVVITDGLNTAFNLTNAYTYVAPRPVLNSDISSMLCSPSTRPTNTTVNCVITTNINTNALSGSVNVRIGSSGAVTNCLVTGIGSTITCNNVAVGGVAGTFTSQYNASGSGSSYLNGNNITVIPGPSITLDPIVGPAAGGTFVTATIADGQFSNNIGVIQTVSGWDHTCALFSNNNVKCWGANYYGQLGYGNSTNIGDNELPSTVGFVNLGGPVSKITASGGYTCALLSSGSVKCWGANYDGQLGYGDTTQRNSPGGDVNVGGTVVDIVAGNSHVCVLLSAGNVRCWGEASSGQLGYGDTTQRNSPGGDIDLGGTVTKLSAGSYHNCAILSAGNVRCWGDGFAGQLGYGNNNNIGDNETPASAGDINVGGSVIQIGGGYRHTCAVLSAGNVRCWGEASSGQLGYGDTTDRNSPGGDVNIGGTVTEIAVGEDHVCALLSAGNLRCWGANWAGQLGYGNENYIGDDELPFTVGDVSVGGIVAKLSTTTSYGTTCIILNTGGMKCWGDSYGGKLGYPNTNNIGDDELPSTFGEIQLLSNLEVGTLVISFDGLPATSVTFVNSTTMTGYTPAHAAGPVNVVITDGSNASYAIGNGFTYQSASLSAILNSNISSMLCSPSSTLIDTTVDCTITTNVDQNTLSGSVNVRVGTNGSVVNCPLAVSGTTLICNNINVGSAAGIFASQYNATGSNSAYADGNSITVTAPVTYPIQTSDITSMLCSPTSVGTNSTVNCTITTNVNLNTLNGSVNLRIGSGGTITNCPVVGSGTSLICNNIPVGSVEGTFTSQYNASGSGSTYLDANNITTTSGGANCSNGLGGSNSQGNTAITNILLCLNGGNLTLTSPSVANFTSVTAATTEQSTSANLNGITVEDLRGSQAGWSLVCKSSNLTGVLDNSWVLPLYKDSASKFGITPSTLQVVTGFGALEGLTDYTERQSTTQLTGEGSDGESNNFNLSSFPSNYGVGKFEKDITLDFTVPAYIRAQAYVGTLICSVS